MNPEDEVPDSSLMTKFRKIRIQTEELLEEMLGKTIRQAIERDMWQSTCRSSVKSKDSISAALREAKEELGIKLERTNGKFMKRIKVW